MYLRYLIVFLLWTAGRGQDNLNPQPAPVNTTTTTTTTRNPRGKNSILEDLLKDVNDDREPVEYEGYDGWYNNAAHPNLGAVDSPLIRILPPAYADGSYKPVETKDRPNPITLSDTLMKGASGNHSKTGKTAFLVFFGQQVVEEILDAQRPSCPPEYYNIPIPEGHEYLKTGHREMPVLRTRYAVDTGNSPNNPRQQLNEITPWIDGGLMYGTSKAWADALRSFVNGTLAASHGGLYPAYNDVRLPMANPPPPKDHYLKPVSRFFKLGNPRGNENPFLLTFGILWFRWHNRIAETLRNKNPGWSDERVFNEARKWVIATYQHIVVDEWLPMWLEEELDPYERYDGSVDPGISHVFQSAAMRFGHTLVVSAVHTRSKAPECEVGKQIKAGGHDRFKNIRTCNSFWNPQDSVLESGIDEILMGLASQPAEREDNVIVEDLRGNVFGPLEFSRRDLMAINIQRGRDHGLPDYRTARMIMLPHEDPIDTWEDMERVVSSSMDAKGLVEQMKKYYNSTREIDIWVGGLLETETSPGPLFKAIIKDQFRRIRDGDRFWFENRKNNLFTEEEIARIKNLTLLNVLLEVTNITERDIQRNPFRLPSDVNPGPECQNFDFTYQWKNVTFQSLPPLSHDDIESCSSVETFDYFSGSEVSYAFTFLSLALFVVGCGAVLVYLARKRERKMAAHKKMVNEVKRKTLGLDSMLVNEWVGKKEKLRQIIIRTDKNSKTIVVQLLNRQVIRSIDLKHVETVEMQISADANKHFLLFRVAREYDLVLSFDMLEERDVFVARLEEYLGAIGVGRQKRGIRLQFMLNDATTKAHRQKQLEKFFRVVFAQAFNIQHDQDELLKLDAAQAKEIINTELTPHEFAESLSLRPDAVFVQQMFALVDADKNGYISFREFLDMIVIFAKGTPEDKAKLMFDMYDIDHSGQLSKKEFTSMIKSMLELANQNLTTERLNQLVNSMFKSANLQHKQDLTFDDFTKLLGDYREDLGYVQLNFDVSGFNPVPPKSAARQSAVFRAHETIYRAYSYFGGNEPGRLPQPKTPNQVRVETKQEAYQTTALRQTLIKTIRFVENYRLHIFWSVLYTLVVFGIFAERAYYYSVEREHGGLRRIAGYGVTVTRGAASVMMFTYSTILLTMCRNCITFLRETFLHRFVPFDATVQFHKYIAFWALVFTVIHSVGHALNFYHISTQTADDLTCLFRDFYHATHELPKFHYWCFQTITGLTGVFLVMVVAVMYVFAIQYSRRHVFDAFWLTHNLYPVLYILMVLHGLGRLVQDPIFYYFFLGPCVLFTVDKLISVNRKKIEIAVIRAELLPSGVTMLEFKRPPNFEYLSGQWVRIACLPLNENEYHPFTLSSAPHEENLTLHIRAVGPWTLNLRRLYDPANVGSHAYPKIFLDGPYGEGHQDWFRFEVSVLVGGGIGVTPFASILKDVVAKSGNRAKIPCKKVYFIWVTRTQKHFEWMLDIIRDVEAKDKDDLVTVHIFITQFYQKFDLRTTMLYICERHFQRISNRSLFTGLQSVTHFGRPNFFAFLNSLQRQHPSVTKVGVFSCGPLPMTNSVQLACERLNRKDGAAFVHHYENF
ncbi:dual oxidase 2-like [Centruroides sculpturatus]|uniref:dual oxidase 2-like n=1 Tax=Centruroides sculpturatus TaxID=218467 RepID=UPI000C6CACCE|nr:dual oxidase 2-like [Centruroides sculpturatus]